MDNTSTFDTTRTPGGDTTTPRRDESTMPERPSRASVRQTDVASAERRRSNILKIVRRVLITLLILVVVAFVAALVAFINMRYYAHDDATDVQGTWYVAGTSTPISIDTASIHLTDDVAYKYTLSADSKTIEFGIGNLEGGGHYRFSLDRQMLAIVDGDFDAVGSFLQDAQWTLSAVVSQVFTGESLTPGEGAKTTLLSRTAA